MRTIFRATDRLLELIHADLDRAHAFAAERVGFLTCGVADLQDGGLCLYGADYHPVSDDDYEDDRSAAAMLGAGAFRKIMQHIYSKPAAVLHVHRHDHMGHPGPSSIDKRESSRFIPSFWNVCPNHPHGTLILSFDDLSGVLWIKPDQPQVKIGTYVIVGDRTAPYRGHSNG